MCRPTPKKKKHRHLKKVLESKRGMSRGLVVDSDFCTGCEYCVQALPEVFIMNDRGASTVIRTDGVSRERIQRVIDNCPAECIHWER